MKLLVDEFLCAGHGLCVEVAPELFDLRPDGVATVLIEEIGEQHRQDAEAAMLRCPAGAIELRK